MKTKHCSLDPIPKWFLKQHYAFLSPYIAHLINVTILTGEFPKRCKIAAVKPLLKKYKLDRELFANYRPVSNLPFISKLLEKAVYSQLIDISDRNGYLNKFQSGFRQG